MTTFSAALAELVTLEAAVAITSPVTATIRRTFRYPPMELNAGDTPCVINLMHQREGEVRWGMSRQELHSPTLIRIVAADVDADRGAEIAHEFLYEMLNKLIDNTTLNGNASKLIPLSVGPVSALEFPGGSGQFWQAADLLIDVIFEEPKTFNA